MDWLNGLFGKDVALNGVTQQIRRGKLDIVTGDGVSATLVDDPVGNLTRLTLTAEAGGGSGTTLTTTLFADAGATGDQDGSIGAPFDDIQSALTALVAESTQSVRVAPGTYSDAFTLNSSGNTACVWGLGPFTTGAITVTDGALILRDATVGGAIAVTYTVLLEDCAIGDAVSGAGGFEAVRCTISSNVAVGNVPRIHECTVSASTIDIDTDTPCDIRRSTFTGQTDVDYTDAAGSITFDGPSYRSFSDEGGTVTNATVTAPAVTPTVAAELSGASHTLDITHWCKLVPASHGSALTVTVPANSALAYPVDTVIGVMQEGAGQVTLAVTTDTLTLPDGMSALKTRVQGSVIWIQKITATRWLYIGGDAEL